MSDRPQKGLDWAEAAEVHRIVSGWLWMYLIPANDLDWRAQRLAIQLGQPVKDRETIRREMADNWATLLITYINEEINR